MAGSTRAECYLNLHDAQEPPSARPSLGAPVPDDPGYALRRHLHPAGQHHRPPVGFGGPPPSETASRQRMADVLLALAPSLPSPQK